MHRQQMKCVLTRTVKTRVQSSTGWCYFRDRTAMPR